MERIALDEVFAAAGGHVALAAALGLHRTTPLSWTQVPAARVFHVAAITGIPAERLRPDMFRDPAPQPA